jgi:hypothetical protein
LADFESVKRAIGVGRKLEIQLAVERTIVAEKQEFNLFFKKTDDSQPSASMF